MFEFLRNWPVSVPDYGWPAELAGARHLAGRLMLAMLFHLSYIVGLVLSVIVRERPAALVIRTDGIGDAILFEPAMESLARALSPHELHLWAPAATCQLMAACPVIRKRISIPRGFKDGCLHVLRSPWLRVRLGFVLGFRRYEVAVYVPQSPEPLGNWLLCSVRAPIRWVNSGDTINQFEWQRARTHARATRILGSRPGAAHELVRNAYLSSQWGGSLELRRPRIAFTTKALAQADRQATAWRLVEQQLRASGIAAIIPRDSQPLNRYPAEKWVMTLRLLWEEHRALCALLGGKGDERLLESIARTLGEVPFLRVHRPLDVLATAALIGRIDALIAVDTGLAHAAIAQEIPTVILRIGGEPGRFFPWPGETRSAVLFKPMPCEGCHNRCHLPEAQCISGIEPQEIVAAYAKLAVSRTIAPYATPAARWLKVAG